MGKSLEMNICLNGFFVLSVCVDGFHNFAKAYCFDFLIILIFSQVVRSGSDSQKGVGKGYDHHSHRSGLQMSSRDRYAMHILYVYT